MKRQVLAISLALLFVPFGQGQNYLSVYAPATLQSPSPALVIVLHGTVADATGANPPTNYCAQHGWLNLADRFAFLLSCPTSTWNPLSKSWFWNAYTLDSLFPSPAPDDSGFVRQNIQSLVASYNVDPTRVFVVGYSSGGFMANRVGIDSSDLVAAIASLSGPVWAGSSTVPAPANPVSVFACIADKDTTVQPCGAIKAIWGKTKIPFGSIDDTINFWLQADGLPPNQAPFCTHENGSLIPNVLSFDAKGSAAEVFVVRELNAGHTCDSGSTEAVWMFFLAHPKAPQVEANDHSWPSFSER